MRSSVRQHVSAVIGCTQYLRSLVPRPSATFDPRGQGSKVTYQHRGGGEPGDEASIYVELWLVRASTCFPVVLKRCIVP